MSAEDRGAGPQVGQTVLYNNSGTIVPAMVYAVATAGTISLVFFNASGATNATGVKYDNTRATASTWSYPDFL